jgi:hypothetical protein
MPYALSRDMLLEKLSIIEYDHIYSHGEWNHVCLVFRNEVQRCRATLAIDNDARDIAPNARMNLVEGCARYVAHEARNML